MPHAQNVGGGDNGFAIASIRPFKIINVKGRALKFRIWIPHYRIDEQYFLDQIISPGKVISLLKCSRSAIFIEISRKYYS